MIYYVQNEIEISSDIEPVACAKVILPFSTQAEIRGALKKPFLNTQNVNFKVKYQGDEFNIFIPRGYDWDGATIPFGFRWILGGCGNPAFLVPSMVHDKLCECKWLINYDRYLSSLIFKNLLLACNCNKMQADIMFFAVDNFQRFMKGWE